MRADVKTIQRELNQAIVDRDGHKSLIITGSTVGEIRLPGHRIPGYLPPGQYDVREIIADPETGEESEIYRNAFSIPEPKPEPEPVVFGEDDDPSFPRAAVEAILELRNEIARKEAELLAKESNMNKDFYTAMMQQAQQAHERQIQFLTSQIEAERQRADRMIVDQARSHRAALATLRKQADAEAEASGESPIGGLMQIAGALGSLVGAANQQGGGQVDEGA